MYISPVYFVSLETSVAKLPYPPEVGFNLLSFLLLCFPLITDILYVGSFAFLVSSFQNLIKCVNFGLRFSPFRHRPRKRKGNLVINLLMLPEYSKIHIAFMLQLRLHIQ